MQKDGSPAAEPAGVVPEEGAPSPAERILAAALECMERDGIEATGIRDIARQAGVNSAAINYYYRSKDNLIRLALERTLENAFSDTLGELDQLLAAGLPARAALERVMTDYVANVGAYPRLAYAHLRDALVQQRYDGEAVKQLNGFLEALLGRLAPEPASERARELRLLLVQAWQSLLLLALLPQLFEPFLALELASGEARARYANRLFAPVYAWLSEHEGTPQTSARG